MENNHLWQTVLAQVQLNVSPANFATWFNNTDIIERKEEEVVVSVPNSFSKEWLEQKYNKEILRILKDIDSSIKKIKYKVSVKKIKVDSNVKSIKEEPLEQLGFLEFETDRETNLNPKYTFDNFIIGPFNEIATAASMAIIESPGKVYNPLFVYGNVGLGKTHLIQAVGNKIKENNKKKKILYLATEKLISMVVGAIRDNSIEDLKKNLRKTDVLIVDDIQFLTGKEKTQEEFFHTFNSLYQSNKQIIFSSDRPPKAIASITERLKSRFEGGMVVDIGSPDYETRLAILKQKAQEKDLNIPPKTLEYIASNIQKSVRELESALNKVAIYNKINTGEHQIEQIKKLLKGLVKTPSTFVNPSKVIETITEFYDLPNNNLFFSSRKKEFARPRQLAMYLLRKELNLSFPAIGRKFGGKDHTTVIHACHLIEKETQQNEKICNEIEMILQRIYSE